MPAPDQRHRQCFEAISLPAGGVGAGADEGQINLAGLQQLIYFAIGFTLDELDFMPQLVANIIQQLMIVNHGFPWWPEKGSTDLPISEKASGLFPHDGSVVALQERHFRLRVDASSSRRPI